jgi:general secretion pathway protein G
MKSTHTMFRRRRGDSLQMYERGLTLIEILVVLGIIGLVLGFLVKNVFNMGESAKASLSKTKLEAIKGPLYLYQLQNNTLPQDLKSLSAVDTEDAWGKQVQYKILDGGRSYELKSLGADGREGGSDANADIIVKGP